MNKLCDKYGYEPNIGEIDRSLEVIAANVDSIYSVDVLKQCFSFMDLTTLSTDDTDETVSSLVSKLNNFHTDYPDYPLPASICVYPNFAHVVREKRCSAELNVTTVAGCFPSSQSWLDVKLCECRRAVLDGADEIDIVLALNSFLVGDYERCGNEIAAMREAITLAGEEVGREIVLKVILETGALTTPENIAEASFLAMENGADFIKTSTGKISVNATPMAAYVMCNCIKAFYQATGKKVGFKAAGGISTDKDAVCYYSIVASILGKDWLIKEMFRLGVSRLANKLISAIENKTVTIF